MATKSTRKFKKGDRVICPTAIADSLGGMTGTVKRYAKGYDPPHVVIARDDGGGWLDGRSRSNGWNVLESGLELMTDYIGYDMD